MLFPLINNFPVVFFCASLGKLTTELATGFPRKQAFINSLAIAKPSLCTPQTTPGTLSGLGSIVQAAKQNLQPLTSARSGRGGRAQQPRAAPAAGGPRTASHPLGWWVVG